MAISLKTAEQIELMRSAGRWVYKTLARCHEVCRPGVTTAEINAQAERILDECGGEPLFKNYPGSSPRVDPFPASTCISVNEQVVHGIPGTREIRDGDIVSIDFGVKIDGWCADSATTVLVGRVHRDVRRLCEVTRHVLDIAIENIRPGVRWSQIARRMERYARQAKLGIVKEFVGHGIGQSLHEEPKIPNFVSRELLRDDIELAPGLVIAVEPMCCLGGDAVRVLPDHWTVVTADGQPAAHYEHTLAVTETGCEILTDGN
jgi:methionyl aminopeptidase